MMMNSKCLSYCKVFNNLPPNNFLEVIFRVDTFLYGENWESKSLLDHLYVR